MSQAKTPIERIPKLGDAHLDAPAESAGGLGHATGNDPFGYDTSDFMKYARQVATDALAEDTRTPSGRNSRGLCGGSHCTGPRSAKAPATSWSSPSASSSSAQSRPS